MHAQIKALREVARELYEEADNLSPNACAHPAPAMRGWAAEIEEVIAKLSNRK